jgi:hypothetical protein
MLQVTHNAGFFSCCNIRLESIINYFNTFKVLPSNVDSSQQYAWYKPLHTTTDITYEYFKKETADQIVYTFPILYRHQCQFDVYSTLPYESLNPFVHKYFSLSDNVKNIMNEIVKKYKVDYDKVCVLFYRGNDKNTETKICGYQDILLKAKQLYSTDSTIRFLVQSDETEFIDFMKKRLPNVLIFKDEIRHMKKQMSTVDIVFKKTNFEFSKKYLAITAIMAKCKYIICTSGNCSMWIMLYRGHAENTHQFLNDKWY